MKRCLLSLTELKSSNGKIKDFELPVASLIFVRYVPCFDHV